MTFQKRKRNKRVTEREEEMRQMTELNRHNFVDEGRWMPEMLPNHEKAPLLAMDEASGISWTITQLISRFSVIKGASSYLPRELHSPLP